jgi:MFS transporter, FHS family, L-fucose permease
VPDTTLRNGQRAVLMLYVLAIWFVISFVTNIIGPLMPLIIDGFHLSLALAGFLPFSFFMAYGIVSIPAGMMVERAGPKRSLLAAFALNAVGAMAFALFPTYAIAVPALFVIGMGMAMLQVVLIPLTRVAGGEAHLAFFSVLSQLVFGLASFVSPLVFAHLMDHLAHADASDWLHRLSPALPWVSLYWLFGALFVATLLGTLLMRIPRVTLTAEERTESRSVYVDLLKQRHVRLYFIGVAAYVGTEQSLANWMSQFLSSYHGASPLTVGATTVSQFWGLMSLGCLLGLGLLKLFDSRLVLRAFVVLAIISVAVALFGSATWSAPAFAVSGFFLSVMFSIITSLALNSVARHHGALSGILCSGILGGAIVPLIVGALGDRIGLRPAMVCVFITLAFILSISFWAKPLVANATLRSARAA